MDYRITAFKIMRKPLLRLQNMLNEHFYVQKHLPRCKVLRILIHVTACARTTNITSRVSTSANPAGTGFQFPIDITNSSKLVYMVGGYAVKNNDLFAKMQFL